MFIIERLNLDYLENKVESAKYKTTEGFVETEQEAVEICKNSRVFTQKDCWAVIGEEKELSYRKIKKL